MNLRVFTKRCNHIRVFIVRNNVQNFVLVFFKNFSVKFSEILFDDARGG
jgi:hypothetical protein